MIADFFKVFSVITGIAATTIGAVILMAYLVTSFGPYGAAVALLIVIALASAVVVTI